MWVDSRVGSKEMLPALRRAGIDAKPAILDSADFAFTGNGPDGDCEVGVERKALNDLVGSLRSGRLQGMSTEAGQESQLSRLHDTYDFVFLLVEGAYSTDRAGHLVSQGIGRRSVPGGFSEDTLEKALLSLTLRGGMILKQTSNQAQSVRWLVSLYRSFTDKQWDQHTTMKTMIRPEKMGIKPVSSFRLAVMDLCPGIGLAASKAVEKWCKGSLAAMLAMPLSAWEDLEVETPSGPRRLGTAKAIRVIDALRRVR
jgi:ERCC4-type nuclease